MNVPTLPIGVNGQIKVDKLPTPQSLGQVQRVASDVIDLSIDSDSLTYVEFVDNGSPAGTNGLAGFSFTSANGDVISLQLINDLSAGYLPAGTYTIQSGDADLSGVPGYLNGYFLTGCTVYTVNGTSVAYYLFKTGTVVVSYSDADHKNMTVSITALGTNPYDATKTCNFTSTCTGVVPDAPEYMLEPTQTQAYSICTALDFSTSSAISTDQDTIYCEFTGDTVGSKLTFPILVNAGVNTLAEGTYSIVDAPSVGTSFKSLGLQDSELTIPYASVMLSASSYLHYFITQGSLTVSAGDNATTKIYTLNVTSFYGSTFKYTYIYDSVVETFKDEDQTPSHLVISPDSSRASFQVRANNLNNLDTVILTVKSTRADKLNMSLAFAVPAGSNAIPVGTYGVETSGLVNTILGTSAKESEGHFSPSEAHIFIGLFNTKEYSITGGSVVVSELAGVKTYVVDLTSHFGSTIKGSCSVSDVDAPYNDMEPTTATVVNMRGISGVSAHNAGDSLGLGLDVYSLAFKNDAEELTAHLYLLAPLNSTELPAGTYDLDFSNASGTSLASKGKASGCRLDTGISFYGFSTVYNTYYFVSGSITVTDDATQIGVKKISGTLTSHFGTVFNFSITSGKDIEEAYRGYETETPIAHNGTFTTLALFKDLENATPEYPSKNVISYQFADQSVTLSLSVVAPAGADRVADGVYDLRSTQDEGTVIASSGINEAHTAFTGSFAIAFDETSPYYFLETGTMTVETVDHVTTFTIDVTSHYGSTFTYTYTIRDDEWDFSAEPNAPLSFEYYNILYGITANTGANQDIYNAFVVEMQSDDFQAELLVYTTSTSLQDGTYTLGTAAGDKVILASAGLDNGSLTYSYGASLIQKNGTYYYDKYFFLDAGTLVIKNGGTQLTLDVTSHFGTTLMMSNMGLATINPSASALEVYAQDHSIYIENAAASSVVVYNSLGQVVAFSKVENGQAMISNLPNNALYLVRCGKETSKIQL